MMSRVTRSLITHLLLLILSVSLEASLHQENVFRITTAPVLPALYSNSWLEDQAASDLKECSRQCNEERNCEAAVFDATNSVCSLHNEAAVGVTSDATPNNLVYLETLCASEADNRPLSCPTPIPIYKDCQEYYELGNRNSGVYKIDLEITGVEPFNVWCDFFDNHGWTVIQKRFDGSVDFYRDWLTYKNGFGTIDGEHWLGNDKIHALTQTNQKLNIYMKAADNSFRNGYWTQFYTSDESDKYRLTISSSGYTGDAEDQFAPNHNGKRFSTMDQDNDEHNSGNCAATYTGAWWYGGCHSVCLNGVYSSNGVSHSGAAGVNWCCSWKGHSDSLLTTIMRVTRD